MTVQKSEVRATLAHQDPEALRAVLDAAGVDPRGAETSQELAERIADAIWWHHSTPVGYLTERSSLEDIVQHAARVLGQDGQLDLQTDGWKQLHQLTWAMLRSLPSRGVALQDLDEVTRSKLEPSWVPTIGLGLGSGGSVGTAWASGKALGFLTGPIGRLLPLLPPVAPYYKAVVTGLGAVRLVAWPLGIALAALSINQALGANERKLIPLLLGLGGLGPAPVVEVEEVMGTMGFDPSPA